MRPALRDAGRTTTYGELNARANRVAHALLRRRGQGEEAVAVLLGKDARLVASFMGIVKAGKIYVPLDPAHPSARSRMVLEDSGAGCILTDGRHAEVAAGLARGGRCEIVDVDRGAGDGAAADADPGLPLTGDTLATLIYTSGSTGRPKGVMTDHRATLHNARRAAVSLGISEADRVFFVQSGSVMGGVRDMLLALLCRAVLVPFDLAVLGVGALSDAVRRERVTIVNTVVTVFRHWVATLRPDDRFPTVRVLKTGSEPLAPADLQAFRRHFAAGARLWAGFGSTETGNVTQVLIDRDAVPADADRVPVGRCFDGLEVLVVDADLRPVPPGETGEVLVRTRYMARGYWRRPELTAQVFLPDPDGGDRRIYRTGDLGRIAPDGSVELKGRLDSMVKVRGQRVELGEVELALLAVPGVKQAAVLIGGRAPGDTRLVAYVAPARLPGPSADELRRALAARLPAPMVPERYVVLPELPSTPQGKVDRRALPAPEWGRTERAEPFVPPRTPIEHELARMWSAALGVDQVGIRDRFMDLGGHSLVAGRITASVAERFGVTLSMEVLLGTPTIEDMAVVVMERLVARASDTDREGLRHVLGDDG